VVLISCVEQLCSQLFEFFVSNFTDRAKSSLLSSLWSEWSHIPVSKLNSLMSLIFHRDSCCRFVVVVERRIVQRIRPAACETKFADWLPQNRKNLLSRKYCAYMAKHDIKSQFTYTKLHCRIFFNSAKANQVFFAFVKALWWI